MALQLLGYYNSQYDTAACGFHGTLGVVVSQQNDSRRLETSALNCTVLAEKKENACTNYRKPVMCELGLKCQLCSFHL